jgi:hypothetical protein
VNDRTPYDGQPFYCALCGCGFGEFLACELPDCRLESPREAERRRQRKKRAGRKLPACAPLAEPPTPKT